MPARSANRSTVRSRRDQATAYRYHCDVVKLVLAVLLTTGSGRGLQRTAQVQQVHLVVGQNGYSQGPGWLDARTG